MSRFGDRSYRFDTDAQWAAGTMRGFAVRDNGLFAEPPLAAHPLEHGEAGVLAAIDACGRLVWLRPATGELIVLHEFGAEPQGRISVDAPIAIHAGPTILWVRCRRRIYRFALRGLQELGVIEIDGLVATATDGGDGLWLLTRTGGTSHVRWLDSHGRFCQPAIELAGMVSPVSLACDPARRRLAILDVPAGKSKWRLGIVDLASCKMHDLLVFRLTEKEPPPAWVVVDDRGGFRIAPANAPGFLLAVSADGIVTARQQLKLDSPAALTGLLWQDGLVVCTARGFARLLPATDADSAAGGEDAVFITPMLQSPPGTPSGWNRADMAVELPRGVSLIATIVTSSSAEIAERFAELATGPIADRVTEIDQLFESPEVTQRAQFYAGSDGEQQLHLLLDRIAAPYLWLRFKLDRPPGAGQAVIRRLKVRYPDRSWLDELPAIYRDDPGSAAQLRQFLAPFETLYGGIDETIDQLPAQIDPKTASEDRLSWLLGWLGFPPMIGLPATALRELLGRAGYLLERRGSIDALRDLLRIVTGNPVSIEDSAATAAFWVIGAQPARLAPRLGRDTRVVARPPGGFRPGSGMRLGEEPLPQLCNDVDRLLSARCGLVTIRIALDPATKDAIWPIVESLLAMFVPAHCRIDLRLAPAGRTPRGGRLDGGWLLAGEAGKETPGNARLDDPGGIELGAETALGAWQLPDTCPPPFTIDGKATLDGVRRVA